MLALLALALAPSFAARAARAASLQANVSYGGSGAVMNVYVPDRVKTSPGIIVSLHYCSGSAVAAASWFAPTLAEQYGFIVIAPGLPPGDGDGCWDVGSIPTKTHGGGSHSEAISQMVGYAITQYGADATRVFAAGASSGAMMTNILLGAYPDVFAAGSVVSGVPFGCWTVADGWDSSCASGNTTKTAPEWGDLVRGAYPGFIGARPRVQLWHSTSDTTLVYGNLAEEVKQWTNVLGLSETPSSTQQNTPTSSWTRTNYQNSGGVVAMQVNAGQGVPYDLSVQGIFPEVVHFFGLDQGATGTGGAPGTGGRMGGTGGSAPGTGGRMGGTGGDEPGTGGRMGGTGGSDPGTGGRMGGTGGGAPGTGGRMGGTGGGAPATGGSGGGAPATGGSGGGAMGTGGSATVGTGGTTLTTGGAGGTTGPAGGTGGAGTLGTGGRGAPGTGGSADGIGGATGAADGGGVGSGANGIDSGCNCVVADGARGGLIVFTLLLAAGALAAARRRSRRSPRDPWN